MNGTHLSLSQAAKETGKSKGTISKYLKNGKLSYVSKDESGYKIDPAELFRVFPKVNAETATNEQSETAEKPPVNSALQARLEVTEERLTDAQATIEDLRARLDASETERRAQTERLLPAPQERRGWLQRVFG